MSYGIGVLNLEGIKWWGFSQAEIDAFGPTRYVMLYNLDAGTMQFDRGEGPSLVALYEGMPVQGDVLVWDSERVLYLPSPTAAPTVSSMRIYNDSTSALEVKRFYKDLTKTATGSGDMQAIGDHTYAADTDYKIEIDSADTKPWAEATFKWSPDAGATWTAEGVSMAIGPAGSGTLAPVLLEEGVYVLFTKGEFVAGDYWTFTAIGTANQLYDLKVDTTNSIVKVGSALWIKNDPNFRLDAYGNFYALYFNDVTGHRFLVAYNSTQNALEFMADSGSSATGALAFLNGTEGWYLPTSTGTSFNGITLEDNAAVPTPLGGIHGGGKFYSTGGAQLRWQRYDGVVRDVFPLALKGDIYTFSTVPLRLAVGTDGQVLTADSTTETGLKWADPITTAYSYDDFIGGDLTTGHIGSLGWTLTVTGTGSLVWATPVVGHPGAVLIATGATSGSTVILQVPVTAATGLSASDPWDVTFIIKTSTSLANAMEIQIGLNSVAGTIASTQTAIVRYLQGTDTYWSLVTNDGGVTPTITASDVTPATNTWYKFRLVRTATYSVELYINGTLKATNTTDQPTTAVNPCVYITNGSAAIRQISLDFFSMRIPGLTR